MKLITFRTFEYAVDAYGLKSLLESNGLACYLFNEHTTSLGLNKGITDLNIELKINHYDLQRAQDLVVGTSYDPEKGKNEGAVQCLNCNSENVLSGLNYFKGIKRFFFFISVFVLAILPFSFRDFYRCENCGHRFRK